MRREGLTSTPGAVNKNDARRRRAIRPHKTILANQQMFPATNRSRPFLMEKLYEITATQILKAPARLWIFTNGRRTYKNKLYD